MRELDRTPEAMSHVFDPDVGDSSLRSTRLLNGSAGIDDCLRCHVQFRRWDDTGC